MILQELSIWTVPVVVDMVPENIAGENKSLAIFSDIRFIIGRGSWSCPLAAKSYFNSVTEKTRQCYQSAECLPTCVSRVFKGSKALPASDTARVSSRNYIATIGERIPGKARAILSRFCGEAQRRAATVARALAIFNALPVEGPTSRPTQLRCALRLPARGIMALPLLDN